MFSRSLNLRIQSPSPTTVKFTVSTRPSHATLSSLFLAVFTFLARIFLAGLVILVNYAKWKMHQPLSLSLLPGTWAEPLFQRFAVTQPWWLVFLISGVIGYAVFRRGYTGMYLLKKLGSDEHG